ncbi:MAG: phosphopentomutase [Clostridiales bacterium]|nr:phosphopentomutase [Clostridiales bacterium]
MNRRAFIIVLDSVGIGEMPDAADFGDEGSNTLAAAAKSRYFNMPTMRSLGLFNIDGVDCCNGIPNPNCSYARLAIASNGKDTTIGHWELAGIISANPLPTYPDGFPAEIIDKFHELTGRRILCNKPYSGTKVIEDYGEEAKNTGGLIVYTSADSVFQIAAHEEDIPIDELYRYCEQARAILKGEHSVGRVIARPYIGNKGSGYIRTKNRRDFSIEPPKRTMLDILMDNGFTTIGVGKISDIFAGKGIAKSIKTQGNNDGMAKAIKIADEDFNGLCFVNLVDFDSVYGHRNDVDGYARALSVFDSQLPDLLAKMREDDMLIITADHGCDPSTPSTDHSREYVPAIIYGSKIAKGINLGTLSTLSDIGATILDYFGIEGNIEGSSILDRIRK